MKTYSKDKYKIKRVIVEAERQGTSTNKLLPDTINDFLLVSSRTNEIRIDPDDLKSYYIDVTNR